MKIIEDDPEGQGVVLQVATYNLGRLYKRLERYPEAAARIEQALSLIEKARSPSAETADFYDLARSLWYAKGTRAQAIQMVVEVRAFFAAKGPNYADYLAEADEWLKTHPK